MITGKILHLACMQQFRYANFVKNFHHNIIVRFTIDIKDRVRKKARTVKSRFNGFQWTKKFYL